MSEPEVECIGELTRQEKDAAGWAGAIDLDAGGVDPPTSTQQPVVVVKEEGTALSASAGIEPGNRESVDRETQRAVKKDAEAPQQPKVVVVKKEGPAPAHAASTFSEPGSLDRLTQLAAEKDEQLRKDRESQQLARAKDEEQERRRLARLKEDDEGRRRDHAEQQRLRHNEIKAESARLKTLAPPGANRPMEPLDLVPLLGALEGTLTADGVSAADVLDRLHREHTDLPAMLGSEANPAPLAAALLRRLAPGFTLTSCALLAEAAFSGKGTSDMLRNKNGGNGLRVRLYALLSLRGALALLPPRGPISSLAGDVATCLAKPRPDLTDGTRGALLALGDAIPRFLEAQMTLAAVPSLEQLEGSLYAERVSAADVLDRLHRERTDLSAMLGSEANPGPLAEELLRRLAPGYTLTYSTALLAEAAFSGKGTSDKLRNKSRGNGLRVRLYALLSLRGALALLPPRGPISSLAGDVATCLAKPRPDLTDGTRGALLALGDAIPRFLKAKMPRPPAEPPAKRKRYPRKL